MANLRAMFAQIDSMEDEIVALHRDLVKIPSVNTGFIAHRGRDARVRVCQGLSGGGRDRVGDIGADGGAGEHSRANRGG